MWQNKKKPSVAAILIVCFYLDIGLMHGSQRFSQK
jgi:hypothetical protein